MNYDEIVSIVKVYADRNDAEVNASMSAFILMAEAKINRLLRIKEMTSQAQIDVTGTEYYALPSTFNGMRDIEVQFEDTRYTLDYMPPSQMNMFSNYDNPNCYHYTLIADKIVISNWLSEIYPDIYLASIIVEIQTFVKNAEGVALWEARFDKAINALIKADDHDRWSGPPMMMRTQ